MSGVTYDDPNRESLGLAPIWTGAGEAPAPPEGGALEFDPADYTVDEIEEYLNDNPDQREAVLAAERKGKGRRSLLGD